MHKVETQHLEQQDNHSIWLHTAEVQHREMDNLVQMAQEPATKLVLAQEAEVKVTG